MPHGCEGVPGARQGGQREERPTSCLPGLSGGILQLPSLPLRGCWGLWRLPLLPQPTPARPHQPAWRPASLSGGPRCLSRGKSAHASDCGGPVPGTVGSRLDTRERRPRSPQAGRRRLHHTPPSQGRARPPPDAQATPPTSRRHPQAALRRALPHPWEWPALPACSIAPGG